MQDTTGDSIDQGSFKPLPDSVIQNLWAQFNERFPTDEDCWQELYKIVNGSENLSCRFCGCSTLQLCRDNNRAGNCKNCRKKSWLTAGTFFNRTRVPKAWLAAIWFMEQGVIISSSRLHKLVGIAQSSALNIFRKLRLVIQDNFTEISLQASSQIFDRSFIKRSRMTPAGLHPQSEELASEDQGEDSSESKPNESSFGRPNPSAEQADFAKDAGCNYSENEEELVAQLTAPQQKILAVLSEKSTSFDELCCLADCQAGELSAALTIFELFQLVRATGGNRYSRLHPKKSQGGARNASLNFSQSHYTEIFGNAFASFIENHFHGISRKYLQGYIAAFWVCVDRTHWGADSIKLACHRHRPIRYQELIDYVTPQAVNLFEWKYDPKSLLAGN